MHRQLNSYFTDSPANEKNKDWTINSPPEDYNIDEIYRFNKKGINTVKLRAIDKLKNMHWSKPFSS